VVVENSLVTYHRLQLGIREDGRPRLDSLSAYPRLTHPTTDSGQGREDDAPEYHGYFVTYT